MRNIVVVIAIMSLFGNLSLVPVYGPLGAAITTAVCVALMKLLFWFAVMRKLKINTLAFFQSAGPQCEIR
jgi:O-antigen/teichoic acid export membrane protein